MRRFAVVACLAAACASTARLGEAVDLTHALRPGIPFYPGGVPFDAADVATHERDGYFARRLSLGEHTGTHVDAPAHFRAGAWTVGEIPPERLLAPLVVIDVRPRVAAAWDYAVSEEDILEDERRNGRIRPGSFVAILTGWGAFWGDPERYRNPTRDGVLRFPGLSPTAARALVERGAVGVGIDTLSIDPGPSTDFSAHKILAGANVYVVENLAHLDRVPPRGARVAVAPIHLQGGSGAPARVIAWP